MKEWQKTVLIATLSFAGGWLLADVTPGSSTVATIIITVALFLCGVGIVRNNQVYRFQTAMVEKIGAVITAEIEAGGFNLGGARWTVLNEVGYSEMVFRFWRSPASFYRGTMIEPLALEVAREQRFWPWK